MLRRPQDATDPTAEDLAAILAKYGNKELTPEAIGWMNEQVGIPAETLNLASTALAPPADPNNPTAITPTLEEQLAEQTNLVQETNQGLGLIY